LSTDVDQKKVDASSSSQANVGNNAPSSSSAATSKPEQKFVKASLIPYEWEELPESSKIHSSGGHMNEGEMRHWPRYTACRTRVKETYGDLVKV